jgi:histidyl-tRNA synthetase
MDKIGLEKVNEEIASKGISTQAIEKLQPILKLSGTNAEKLIQLKSVLDASEIGLKGVSELETIFALCETMNVQTSIELDLTLARGLNYYTGAIFEVKALDVEIGSITGGGRYDNLIGVFGMEGVSGVGISFGADRIYDVLNTLNLYPETSTEQTRILFVSFGEKELMYCLPWLNKLRNKGINSEIYPEPAKMKKQMSYADNKGIPFVAIVGETEMNQEKVMLKNMKTGEQSLVSFEELQNVIS